MSKESSNIAKGIAIILMYVHHLFYSQDLYGAYSLFYYPLSLDQTLWFSNFAKVCVSVFVFVTAYGITKQYIHKKIESRNELITNTIKRYINVIMAYWFVFVLSIIIFYHKSNQLLVYGESLVSKAFYIFIDFMGLANIMTTPTFNLTWWYMSLLTLLIFVMPVLLSFQRRFGSLILLTLSFLLLLNFRVDQYTAVGWYTLTVVSGIVLASTNFYEIVNNSINQSKLRKLFIFVISLFMFIAFSIFRQSYGYLWITDAILAILVGLICEIIISKIKVISIPLNFIGKNSMNMFLTHTFVYYYYFRDFTYSFGNSALVVLVLVLVTLLLSILIEETKKVIRYDKLVMLVTNKVSNFIVKIESENI